MAKYGDEVILIPSVITPSGWTIAQIYDSLTVLSPCCGAVLYTHLKDIMQCADCGTKRGGPPNCQVTARLSVWQHISTAVEGGYIEEWISAWTGFELKDLHVTVDVIEL